MSHPVVEKRNEEIRKEFKELYDKEYLEGTVYVEEILRKLGEKYKLEPCTIKKIVYSK